MQIYLPDLIDWCISNILHIDLGITILTLIFILYARDKEIYYAKDYKHSIAIHWHWRIISSVILWSLFMLTTVLYHFSF
jgi:hypothetical protein